MANDQKYTYMWQSQPYISWKGNKSDNGVARNLFNVISGINKRPVPLAVKTAGGYGNNKGGHFGPHQKATAIPATTVGRNSRVANSKNNKPEQSITGQMPSGVGAIARNFEPQPMKHWRLQLNTVDNQMLGGIGDGIFNSNQKTGSYNKVSIANLIDRPGGSSVSNKPDNRPNSEPCEGCDPIGNSQFSKQYYQRELLWGVDISFSYSGDKWLDCSTNNGLCKPVCVACNPENNIIKSAVTLLKKNYYTDSRAYLKSRCKTYDQKQNITTLVKPKSNFILGSTIPAWPQDNGCGPETFYIGTCPDKCQSTAKDCSGNNISGIPSQSQQNMPRATAIFKPNNRQFQVQGAVDSSSRIARLKYNTVTKNAAGFSSAFGAQAANAAKYSANGNGPYFIKNKIFTSHQCKTSSLVFTNGNSNVCKPIPRKLGYPQMPGGNSGCRGPYGSAQAICS